MKKLIRYLERQPRWLILVVCVLLTIIIGVVDYITGDLSLALFYVIPVFLGVRLLKRNCGLFIAVLCGALLFSVDRIIVAGEIPLNSTRTWNSIIEGLLLIFIGYILNLLNNELAQKKKQAEDLEAANIDLDAFNYSVAHDLRKPLTIINGYSQIITDLCAGIIDEQCREYLNKINEGTRSMSELIDALLTFSRLGHTEPRLQTMDLTAMAKTILAEMRLAEPDRKVDMQIAEGITAIGDPQMLSLVLENLFGNAWKYTSKVPHPLISFGISLSEGKPIYHVRDNGVGFDELQADKLFIPFQRLHTADEFAGFGIGLATVKRIIQRHGGQIWAQSEKGNGATFYFTLHRSSEITIPDENVFIPLSCTSPKC